MNSLRNIINNQLTKRIVMTTFGIAILGLAVGMLKTADFGTDPFTVFMMGLWSLTSLDYGFFALLVNAGLLVIMFFLNRSKIGIGTFINMFFFGYIVEFSWKLVSGIFPNPSLTVRIILLVAAIIVLCFASSLYFVADLGISTYDVYAVTLGERTQIPFKFWRILTDSICVMIGYSLGETVGIATLATALFMGPLITFFSDHVARPMLGTSDLTT